MNSNSKLRSGGDAAPATAAAMHGTQPRHGSRRVIIDGLEIMASVGVFEVEHRYEQRVLVSLDLDVADTYDGVSERLADVLDYSDLVRMTESLAQSRHYKLIETLAEAVATACLIDARVQKVAVRIEKPDVIPNCRSVGIEIVRRR